MSLLCRTLLLVTLAAAPAQAVSFTYQTILDPAAGATRVFGINDNGVLSGDHSGGSIFTWANGVFTEFNQTDSGGADLTYDTRINNAGQLVGTDSSLHAFTLLNGVATQLQVPGATLSFGSGINNNGLIVGGYYNSSDLPLGFELQGGTYSTVEVSGATFTDILGVDDNGDIAGAYGSGGAIYGYTIVNGVFSTLSEPSSSNNYIWGINDSGNLAGDSSGSPLCGSQGSCGWFYDGTFSAVAVPGALSTTVQGMNSLNQIVGYYVSSGGQTVGFLATPDTIASPEPGTFLLMATCLGATLVHFRRVRPER